MAEYIVIWDRGNITHTMTFYDLVESMAFIRDLQISGIAAALAVMSHVMQEGTTFWLDN